ncbi:MAG: hypothetical protein K9G67_04045 [Bacteroidales bacterium]|nr:hypothetical protein [Bacteroidales bacterium]MCF8345356.1 hypothetical protein [Bacteroidales bacterium]MCF8352030.1 hypothetical protein [Bacteroidales bacterium]MCF8375503.1 hypothetical protein [Bacteroidales bacterium]MCF8399902.1 hypothetical protein [Bacteroidales bacterium]
MSALLIKLDPKSNRILKQLAEKLGGKVVTINDDQYEDFLIGKLMDQEKTNELVSRDLVFQKLKSK